MVRLNPKSFAQPDLLNTIQPCNLLRLLEPCRTFLEDRGLSLPREDHEEIDYFKLASILATPDKSMDSRAVEGLNVIGDLATDENFSELLDIARRNSINVETEATAADLVTKIWLEAPQALLELKERDAGSRSRRRFESFRARDPHVDLAADALPRQFDELEADLKAWFISKKCGIGCRVIRTDSPGEIRFMVHHGQPCKRQPSLSGLHRTYTLFRPARTDLVIYDTVNQELRISAGTKGELQLYREKFGQHVFGDRETFIYTQKYTLTPLKREGLGSLHCKDVQGMEWVRLAEIAYAWPGTLGHIEKHQADDLFSALQKRRLCIEARTKLLHARFAVKLAGEANPGPVFVQPPNVVEYGRGEDAVVIENWLRARGFVMTGTVPDDEIPTSFVENA